MALVAGTRLGPYEIVAPLGAGGMGEVWKARDTRLERTVAIKILNSQLVASPQLRARFEREAKVISQLQHPNICVLHDVGCDSGTDFLVMEFLEGETLADRLRRGALPIAELLKTAIEIADALQRAHRAGVVHRDLKPANVMLTKSGAKLLDFGLAKPVNAMTASAPSGALPSFTAAPTMTGPSPMSSPLTAHGAIVGTVQYMSPEQVEGKEADARSDLFAFGAMLYEMATGQRAFPGKSQIKVASAILEDDPPSLRSLDAALSPELDRVVSACLAKSPDQRYQCAHDLKLQLLSILAARTSDTQRSAPAWRTPLLWTSAAALVLAAVLAALSFSLRPHPSPRQVTRFDINLGTARIIAGAGSRVAISQDGRTLVMALKIQNGKSQLFLRRLGGTEVEPLPGTENATQPFFSPDGRWIGYTADGKLMKLLLAGGVPVTICDIPGATASGTWGTDGKIVFSAAGVLREVPSEGGTPAVMEWASRGNYAWVSFLPGGRALLAVSRRQGTFEIHILRMDSHTAEVLIPDASWPRYLSSGFLIYAQYGGGAGSSGFTGGLLAVPFDLQRLKKTGPAQPVLQQVEVGYGGAGFYDVSSEGTIAYFSGQSEGVGDMDFFWTTPPAQNAPLNAPEHHYHTIELSPDGKHVTFSLVDPNPNIGTFDIAKKTFAKVTFDGHSIVPIFSADGRRVIYAGYGDAPPYNLRWKAADGSADATPLSHSPYEQRATSASPDGTMLAYTETHPDTKIDIYLLSLRGDPAPHPWLNTPFNESHAQFSPNGKYIAYVSDESGASQVYVRPLDGKGGKWQISTDAGNLPRWSPDGKQLFYLSIGKLMVVNVNTNGGFSADTARAYMDNDDLGHTGYAIGSDGRVFRAISKTALRAAPTTTLRVIENFDVEVKERMALQEK